MVAAAGASLACVVSISFVHIPTISLTSSRAVSQKPFHLCRGGGLWPEKNAAGVRRSAAYHRWNRRAESFAERIAGPSTASMEQAIELLTINLCSSQGHFLLELVNAM